MTATLQAHGNEMGMATLRAALGVPRSSAYRWLRPPARPQAQVLAYRRDPRFADRGPGAGLRHAARGRHLCVQRPHHVPAARHLPGSARASRIGDARPTPHYHQVRAHVSRPFDGFAHANAWCGPFFQDDNHEHQHEGIAWFTPATVHEGRALTVLAPRQAVMDAAYQQHPERFVKGPPRVPQLPPEVWINKAEDQTAFVG